MNRSEKIFLMIFFLIGFYWTLPYAWSANSDTSSEPAIFEETLSPAKTEHPSLWLESGAEMIAKEDGWETIHGELDAENKWRRHYLRANPMDTDNGYHPQNIFKLLTKQNFSQPFQEFWFEIDRTNLSLSPNRNAESGIFLYLRYKDLNNYYYAGIQSDGKAVIKKKFEGSFKVLAEAQVFEGEYDRNLSPTLLPQHENIGLNLIAKETDSGLEIRLLLAEEDGEWIEVLKTQDAGKLHGDILTEGTTGIRTDFMDVSFKSYLVREQNPDNSQTGSKEVSFLQMYRPDKPWRP